jgi:hypothetical protein
MEGKFSMPNRTCVLVLASVLAAAAGCRSKEGRSSDAPAPSPAAAAATGVKLGAPIGASPMVSLASIARDTTKYARTSVKTEGRVIAVCQAMGCWMEIADANGEAHVRMKGHSFFIPKTASGRRAIVEATVLPRPDNGECEQEAAQATGQVVKVELDATGVELL